MVFSLKPDYIAVNYHYVENPRANAGDIYPCSIAEFERQISFLADHFRFVSIPEMFEAAQNHSKEKLCAITFDDGLKDQFENAVPLLKKYNTGGTFFIITGTIMGMLPLAYKIHLLTSCVPMNDVATMFNTFLSDYFPHFIEQYKIPRDRRITNRRLHESMLSANIKETLIMIPTDMRTAFFDFALKGKIDLNETERCKDIFMNGAEITMLEHDGFTIGSHTHQHESLEYKDETFISRDIRASADIFAQLLNKQPTIMSYPHGRSNIATWNVLQESGFTHGVTIERRGVLHSDDPLRIPRFDTGDVKDFLNADE